MHQAAISTISVTLETDNQQVFVAGRPTIRLWNDVIERGYISFHLRLAMNMKCHGDAAICTAPAKLLKDTALEGLLPLTMVFCPHIPRISHFLPDFNQ